MTALLDLDDRTPAPITVWKLCTGAIQIWRMDIDGQNQKQLTFGEQKERAHSAVLSPD